MNDLWSAIARAQESLVTHAPKIQSLRAVIVEGPKARRVSAIWWALPLVPALGVLLWLVLPRLYRAPSFAVGSNMGAVGVMLVAQGQPLPVNFADGSTVVLAAGAKGKVASLGKDGADLVLTTGALQVHVVHAQRTTWRFLAGPFEILVTGTKFRASWDAPRSALEVAMQEGSVRVSGGGLNQPLQLHKGETLRATLAGHNVTRALGDIQQAQTELALVPSTYPPDATQPATLQGPVMEHWSRSPLRALPTGPTWQALAARGSHAEALAVAKRRGVQHLIHSLSASDLLLLADTARYAQEPDVASLAFESLVTRFPQAPEATDAAFGLGRLAYAQEKWTQSAQWFENVVTKVPEGPLAPAAWGRLMESQERARDLVAARRSARRYLELYPQGNQRGLAQRLLGQGATSL